MKQPSKELLAEWAAKLEASGFRDLERPGGSLLSSRGTPSHLDEVDDGQIEAAQAIDDRKRELMRRPVAAWPSPMHRELWRLHLEGMRLTEIRKRLRVGMRRIDAAYKWCCDAAGVPSNHGNPLPVKQVKPVNMRVFEKRLGLRELLTIIETARLTDG